LWTALPSLWDFLTDPVFTDGSVRERPTLLLFVEGARWKGCLMDRAEGAKVFVAGESVEEVLKALEKGLAAQSLDWR
jgi:hypothetical protein